METASSTVPSIVVYVTVPNKEAGKKLSESIIKERLAACVNIVPGIKSVYWWEGKVQTDSEELLIIKTREALLAALTQDVRANHEYEVPEVVAFPINGGNLSKTIQGKNDAMIIYEQSKKKFPVLQIASFVVARSKGHKMRLDRTFY